MVVVRKPRPAKVRAMLLETIRQFHAAAPFEPFVILTNGGRRFEVPHPEFLYVAPKGTWLMVTDDRDRPHHISILLIEEVMPLRRRRRAKRT
jgi:hypothetical protein